MTPTIRYRRGALDLLLQTEQAALLKLSVPELTWDKAAAGWTAPGCSYRPLVLAMRQHGIEYQDEARGFSPLNLVPAQPLTPRKQQAEALQKWEDNGRRGVIALPTGGGKTFLAMMAMTKVQRPTLITVPTIDLMIQWRSKLAEYFNTKIGSLGGGTHDLQPITVSTYDSAANLIENFGQNFGLLVCDECHHLAAPHYRMAALASIAPFRLGLSATVERVDGGEAEIYQMLGEKVYEAQVSELVNDSLAPYEVISVEIPLSPEEQASYQEHRQRYIQFIRQQGIQMGSPQGWQDFIRRASYNSTGRAAMASYYTQKRIALGAQGKLRYLWQLLLQHSEDKIIIFTNENAFAYEISRTMLLPIITHKTPAKEREALLEDFRTQSHGVLVTSKVLNEGIDVPEANVAIIVSGGGSVREHVQRLGRILRMRPGKKALLYELVAADTGEMHIQQRRRQHHAYQEAD